MKVLLVDDEEELVTALAEPGRLETLPSPRLDAVLRLARRTSTLPRLALNFDPSDWGSSA